MTINLLFILNSALLGLGLAMDAFSVSLANGLKFPNMNAGKMSGIAGTFGLFQAAMPLVGWACVHTITNKFQVFQRFIPWIAFILLSYIGGKMLIDGIRSKENFSLDYATLTFTTLILQGIATSIDALSVGFTISNYDLSMALLTALIIAFVTFITCILGLILGKIFGIKLAGKAEILGGIILIGIGFNMLI